MESQKKESYAIALYLYSFFFFLCMVMMVLLARRFTSPSLNTWTMVVFVLICLVVFTIKTIATILIKNGNIVLANFILKLAKHVPSEKEMKNIPTIRFDVAPFIAGIVFHYSIKLLSDWISFLIGLIIWFLIIRISQKINIPSS